MNLHRPDLLTLGSLPPPVRKPDKIPRLPLMFLSVFLMAVSAGCSDNDKALRKEYIVADNTVHICNIIDSTSHIYISANVPYQIKFETDAADKQWLTYKLLDNKTPDGEDIIEVTYKGMEGDYTRRSGTLSIYNEAEYIACFVRVVQGFNALLDERFDEFRYNSPTPFETENERNILDWTTEQRSLGWKCWGYVFTDPEGAVIDTAAYIYGKQGYLKLGDENYGANIITPSRPAIYNDSIYMLRFNAVAHVSEAGVRDDNKLTVNIVDGGAFDNGQSSITIDLPYYDHTSADLSETMWKNTEHIFYIVDTDRHPISQRTRIEFLAGEFDRLATPNRVYIDNVSLYILDEDYYLMFNPDKRTAQD